MTKVQQKRLRQLLLRGARAAGYPTELWTLKRIATLIGTQFGVRYSPVGVWKLLRQGLGWSWQKPERRALQRDEPAIAHWKTHEWPRVKNAARRGAHLVFLDESAFLLIPNVRKTWAPIGCTPTIHHSYQRDKLSAISAVSVSPARLRVGLYMHLHPDNITGAEVVVFLRDLLRHLRGPIDLLGDGGSIHKREDVKVFLRPEPTVDPSPVPGLRPRAQSR